MFTQYARGGTENRNAANLTNIYIQINSYPKLYYNKCVLSINMQLHYITLPWTILYPQLKTCHFWVVATYIFRIFRYPNTYLISIKKRFLIYNCEKDFVGHKSLVLCLVPYQYEFIIKISNIKLRGFFFLKFK